MLHRIEARIADVLEEQIPFTVEASRELQFGHYASNVAMRLASPAKKSAFTIATDLTQKLLEKNSDGFFERVEVAGPGFINFWLSKETLQDEFKRIVKAGALWGRHGGKVDKTIVIDYSHPNIAKPMSVAHLRSTIIGAALYNVFQFSGWKTIGDNHLGDWGKQFGVLIAAYKEKNFKIKKPSIKHLMELYVDYTSRMKDDEALEATARAETKKLQDGDAENMKLWKAFYGVSLDEFKKIYDRLGVSFDYHLGESYYKGELKRIVQDALDRGIAHTSEGAVVIPVHDRPPFVIEKSDGAHLYSTTDIAAIGHRVKKFKPDVMAYVVDNGQSLHFEQLFSSVRSLGLVSDEKLTHVKFGLILSEDLKKLSTREGRHISLEAVIDEAISRAKQLVDEKRPDLKERERVSVAEAIGVAALKYNDLSQNRQSDIAFRWEKMLNFEGNSAPYIMYTYTRLKSILRKKRPGRLDASVLATENEHAVLLKLIQFPEVINQVRTTYFPHYLAEYLYGLARLLNQFYHSDSVLQAEDRKIVNMRLNLVAAAADTLKQGLALLGINALEKM